MTRNGSPTERGAENTEKKEIALSFSEPLCLSVDFVLKEFQAMTINAHLTWKGESPLVCARRIEETPDTATFVLSARSGVNFDFLPGQFISVGATIDAKTHWRAYSISSSPTQSETLSITVKRVAGGLVSNWLIDNLKPGMELPALASAGNFSLGPGGLPPAVALFSAGSGITPMMSMTRWLLETQAGVDIHFFHSARSEVDFIFGDELLALEEAQPHLHLHLFLTRGVGKISCHPGRIDAARLKSLLPPLDGLRAWLCGSDGYMDSVAGWLREAGLTDEAIMRESFTPAAAEVAVDALSYRLDVPAFGKSAGIMEGESLLDAMEREGLPIIGACRTGVCGSCKCRVESGEVVSTSIEPLTPDEIVAGYVLACSSVAKGDVVVGL